MRDLDVSAPVLPENMALGNSVARSTNSPEMIFSLIRGGTGGSDTSERVATLVVVTIPGRVLVFDVVVTVSGRILLIGSVTLDGVWVSCCCIEASDKASVRSSASGVEVVALCTELVW